MKLKSLLGSALLSAAACFSHSAHAGAISGTFDPAFGQPYPNLGFRGTFTVYVSDACLQQSPGYIANESPCSESTMALQSATLELYNVNTPGNPTVQTLELDPKSFVFYGIYTYFDPTVGYNRLLGVDAYAQTPGIATFTDPGPLPGTSDDIVFNAAGFFLNFFVQFGEARALNASAAPDTGVSLYICDNYREDAGSVYCDSQGYSQNPAILTFNDAPPTGVPEPRTLALSLLALAAAAGVRRARRKG